MPLTEDRIMAMAKKKRSSTGKESGERRRRRSDEELIADLQEKIRQVKTRAATREMKKSPAMKLAISALKSIDKGLEVAAEENQSHLRHALADARKPLAEYLATTGFAIPKANLPRGRRPKLD